MKLISLLLFYFSLYDLAAQVEFYDCPKAKTFQYVPNAKLIPKYLLGKDSTFYNWKIDTGSSIVLKYEQRYDCSENGHFGVIASLIWSIPANSTEFEIQLNKIDSLKTSIIYLTGCGPPCKKYNFEMITADGNIQGSLTDNVWQIKGNIKMLLHNKTLNLSASKDLIVNGDYVMWKQKRKDKKEHTFNDF